MEEVSKINLNTTSLFIDFCKDNLRITTNGGLRLFTNNIYTNNKFVREVPFIGQKLYLHPFNFGVKEVLPTEIFVSSLVKKEMVFRFEKLHYSIREKLHNDLANNKTKDDIRKELEKRENLHNEFIGTVTDNFKHSPKPGHICLCLEDVRLKYGYKSLTDHLWVVVPKNLFNDLNIETNDKIQFFGVIYPYIQFDQVNMHSFIDYSIKVMTFHKTNL